jgi:anti-anti-sigma factor
MQRIEAQLDGVLDVRHIATLHSLLLQWADRIGDYQVDISRVERIDSAALQLLLSFGQFLQGRGGQLKLVSVPEPVKQALTLAGLDRLAEAATAR